MHRTRIRLGRFDPRVPHKHTHPANPGAAMAWTHARLQVMAPSLYGLFSPLHLRRRAPLRHRLASMVDPRFREEDWFHASICRLLERSLSHCHSHPSLLRSRSLFRRWKVPFFLITLSILRVFFFFNWVFVFFSFNYKVWFFIFMLHLHLIFVCIVGSIVWRIELRLIQVCSFPSFSILSFKKTKTKQNKAFPWTV